MWRPFALECAGARVALKRADAIRYEWEGRIVGGKRVFAVLEATKGSPVGAAFCVCIEPPLLVTCAHTVARARGEKELPRSGALVRIRIGGDAVDARVVRNSITAAPNVGVPRTALTVLTLQSTIKASDVRRLLELVEPRGEQYWTYGFPEGMTERGIDAHGKLADFTQDGDALVVLRGESTPAIAPGFSGAPVWLATGEVVGVIAAALEDDGPAIAYMVPAHTIAALVDGLPTHGPIRIPRRYPKRLSHVPDLLKHFEQQPPRTKFDLRLALGATYGELTDILNPTSWAGPAPMIEDAYPANSWPANEILSVLTDHPRLRLQSPGGSGKTSFLAGAVKACIEAGRTVFFLDLSRRVDVGEQSAPALFDAVSVGASFNQFVAALEDGESGQNVLFVDGLNEQSVFADVIVKEIEQLVRKDLSKAFMVLAGRMKSFPPSLFSYDFACIRPLSGSEIRAALGPNAPSRPHPLLATPFFLDLRVTRAVTPTDAIRLKSGELEAYLRSLVKNEGALETLSDAAWEIYSIERSMSAPEQAWIQAGMDDAALARHVGDGLMNSSSSEHGRSHFQFRHQLIHDYLVSRRLVRMGPSDWRAPQFDEVTLDASSFDALSLAAEQIEQADALIEFLREMYDWNYRAVLDCLNTLDPQAVKRSPEVGLFRDAVYALNCLRLFDRFWHTAMEMRAARAAFRGTGFLASMRTVADLLRTVSTGFLPGPKDLYYADWKALFLRQDPVLCTDIALLWKDPLMAWTAANVFRRIGVGDDVVQELKRDYMLVKATAGNSERGVAARWRFVHVLGGTSASDTLEFLFNVVSDRSEDTWVRYGAVRSWVECLLLQPSRADRKAALDRMSEAIGAMRDRRDIRVLGELLKCETISPDWSNAVPPSWKEDFRQLYLCAIEAATEIGDMHQAKIWADSLETRGV